MDVAQARHAFHKLCFHYGAPPQPVASVSGVLLPRPPAAGGPLHARLYRPADAPAGEPLPAVLWLHGGGWVLGNLNDYDAVCRALANVSGALVLALEYRLAPEHPFPAAVEDTLFALDWLAAHAASLGADPVRLAVAGDSAGATLAAVAGIQARDAGWPAVRSQVLVYPLVDRASERVSHETYAEGFLLDEATLRWFEGHSFTDPADRHDWRASPLLAPWLGGLPPATVVIAECDVLADDVRAFATALADAGSPVRVLEIAGAIHGFLSLGGILPQAGETLARIGQALRETFSGA